MQVEVRGTKTTTEYLNVKLDLRSVFETLARAILARHQIYELNAEVKDGKLVFEEEQHTSHSYYVTKVLQENPSEEVLNTLRIVNELRKEVSLTNEAAMKRER